MDITKEIIKENIDRVKKGLPLTLPLVILNGKMRKAWYCETNKDKIKAYRKTYNKANKDKIKVKSKAYHEANKDKRKAYCEANKDKIKVRMKAYYEANKKRIKDVKKVKNE